MRTTIDLPDALFRQAKSEAALRGMKFKEYAAALFRQGLTAPREDGKKGISEPIPVVIAAERLSFPKDVTNADLFAALDREDDERMNRVIRDRV